MKLEADVLVAGGGPAGSSAAIALARLGHRVVLAERVSFPRPRIGESLPPKVARLLALLGVAERIDGADFLRMRGTTVHDGDATQTHDFDPEGRELGYQVDRARFDQLLLEEARAQGATVLESTPVTEVVFDEAGRVRSAGLGGVHAGGSVACAFLVDATGARGLVSRALGARRREDVRTVALTGYYRGTRTPEHFPAENTLFEVRPDGWVWSVLLGDGRRNVTLGLDPETLKTNSGRPLEQFEAEARASLLVGPLIEGATLVDDLVAHDATWASAETYARGGVFLAGDAASFIDPLTSHGVYKALHAGVSAATAVNTALAEPARAEAALAWYDANQRRTFARYAEAALAFYRASKYSGSNFWRVRTRAELSSARDPSPSEDARAQRSAAFLEAIRGPDVAALVLTARPGLAVEARPTPVGWMLREQPVFTWAGEELLAPPPGLDVRVLLGLLDGRPLERVFEGYVAATGVARGRELGRALAGLLSELVGLEVVTTNRCAPNRP